MCCPSKQKPKSPSTFIIEPFSNQYKVTKSGAERERELEIDAQSKNGEIPSEDHCGA